MYYTSLLIGVIHANELDAVAEELKRDGLIDFVFVDADTEIELLEKFAIKSVPTYILLEDGREVGRMNGAKTREQFLEFVND